jgi:hypothetical protein
LTWLPFDDRTEALANIAVALRRVKEQVEKNVASSKVKFVRQSEGRKPS